ncbi:glycerophosphodiester phosphodiesterase [Parachlamydia sp. AcF125]|uniref:glycerophosphodiester phosphodiesterase n=1 Tax=Parachlamydia sp. AcF125 TaxID=2795736 RepID=UPI001BC9DB5C|nr:glycerophosphodiester phosphodiesterase [Parachlamydia sp. AcF125]MBS4167561.1 Glycerophosphodiester phosphodiesterase [Parachlamydia sp. AcF125]
MDIFFQTSLHPHLPLSPPVASIAHRGNSSDAPENTLFAFQQALEIGVDYIEVDVHLSKDGIPVVIHDLYLSRTIPHANGVAVMDCDFSALQNWDAGEWFDSAFAGQKIPSLAEVLVLCKGKCGVMVEIKEGSAPPKELAQAVLKVVLAETNRAAEVVVGSLSADILKALREMQLPFPLVSIIDEEKEWHRHAPYEPDIVAMHYSMLTQRRLSELKQMRKKVWVWTVDEPGRMHYLIQARVDGIISNCPRELKQVFALR